MLVSVITSVYNCEMYIEEAVESILTQTYPYLEYIIINDGSTDGTPAILNKVKDPRVKIIHLKENIGAASCLNIGIERSSGEFIAIQDADDISMPTRFEEQVNFLISNKEFIGVASFINTIQGKHPVSEKKLQDDEQTANQYVSDEKIYEERYYSCFLVHGSVLFYKDIFIQVDKYNPKYKIAYDHDLWLRMFEIGKIAKIPRVLYKWRVNSDSLFRKNTYETCNEVLRVSTSAIYRELQKNNSNPTIGIFGTKKACYNFHQEVASIEEYQVKYFNSSMESKILRIIHQEINDKNIDGIIILDYGYKSKNVYDKLIGMGLKKNETLFFLWNVIN